MNHINVIKQVAALPGMSTEELKRMWADLHKAESPPFNRMFLVRRLAHRIQELSLGGMDAQLEKRLERIDAGDEGALQERKRPPGERLLPGTKLVREWKGVEHCCMVLEDGFEYQGRKFGSLSAVANFISGTKWNGHVFWGLRRQGEKS
ncbi:MAG: DUF2924 domain-containing protein [Magnetococcales bacterium]|nr:DUF2924 domain-containing protein [Magnetococcales bacterium]